MLPFKSEQGKTVFARAIRRAAGAIFCASVSVGGAMVLIGTVPAVHLPTMGDGTDLAAQAN
jgi:hypothetical protein